MSFWILLLVLALFALDKVETLKQPTPASSKLITKQQTRTKTQNNPTRRTERPKWSAKPWLSRRQQSKIGMSKTPTQTLTSFIRCNPMSLNPTNIAASFVQTAKQLSSQDSDRKFVSLLRDVIDTVLEDGLAERFSVRQCANVAWALGKVTKVLRDQSRGNRQLELRTKVSKWSGCSSS